MFCRLLLCVGLLTSVFACAEDEPASETPPLTEDTGSAADVGEPVADTPALETPEAADTEPDPGPEIEPDTGPEVPPVAFCESETEYMYAPLKGAELETFPDDFYTSLAADSPTGLRLRGVRRYEDLRWRSERK